MIIENPFDALLGRTVENFRVIAGGSLILYIGNRIGEQGLTEWGIDIEPAWRLDRDNNSVIGSFDTLEMDSSDSASIDAVLDRIRPLIGTRVDSVKIGTPIVDLVISFGNLYQLTTFSHSVTGENWELRYSGGTRWGMSAPNKIRTWREAAG